MRRLQDLEDDELHLHFLDADEARRYAREVAGWTSPDGRRWYCEGCSEPEVSVFVSLDARVAVIDGQLSLECCVEALDG